jgi:hypothetical protein
MSSCSSWELFGSYAHHRFILSILEASVLCSSRVARSCVSMYLNILWIIFLLWHWSQVELASSLAGGGCSRRWKALASCWVARQPRNWCRRSMPVGFDVIGRLSLFNLLAIEGPRCNIFHLPFDICFLHQLLQKAVPPFIRLQVEYKNNFVKHQCG